MIVFRRPTAHPFPLWVFLLLCMAVYPVCVLLELLRGVMGRCWCACLSAETIAAQQAVCPYCAVTAVPASFLCRNCCGYEWVGGGRGIHALDRFQG